MSLRISVAQDGKPDVTGEVADIHAIPEMVFNIAQHYGGGEFVASILDGEHGAVFKLTLEWLE